MNDKLPIYKRENPCPKCGVPGAFSRFKRGSVDIGRPERLERECTNCTYKWDEAPIDSAPKKKASA